MFGGLSFGQYAQIRGAPAQTPVPIGGGGIVGASRAPRILFPVRVEALAPRPDGDIIATVTMPAAVSGRVGSSTGTLLGLLTMPATVTALSPDRAEVTAAIGMLLESRVDGQIFVDVVGTVHGRWNDDDLILRMFEDDE